MGMRSVSFFPWAAGGVAVALVLVQAQEAPKKPDEAPNPKPSSPTADPARVKQTRETFLQDQIQRVRGEVMDLSDALALLTRKHISLMEELKLLREENEKLVERLAKGNRDLATREDLASLAKSLRELDEKRVKDFDVILKEVERMLKKTVRANPKPPASTPTGPGRIKGFEHVVQQGEFVSTILAAFNTEFKKQGEKPVTLSQVLKANPGLNANNIRVGQKILIPMPGQVQ